MHFQDQVILQAQNQSTPKLYLNNYEVKVPHDVLFQLCTALHQCDLCHCVSRGNTEAQALIIYRCPLNKFSQKLSRQLKPNFRKYNYMTYVLTSGLYI